MTIKHMIVHVCDACGRDEKASRTTRLRMGPYKAMDLCQPCRDKVERFIHDLHPGAPWPPTRRVPEGCYTAPSGDVFAMPTKDGDGGVTHPIGTMRED